METVLLTGGKGLIGQQLCKLLLEKGYQVAILSRTKDERSGIKTYIWNPEKGEIEQEAMDVADYIVHLAGENIGEKRWTKQRKKQIIDSRVDGTNLLFKKFKHLKAFISASAVGYYGMNTSHHFFTEMDPPAQDFLGETCLKWEKSADQFRQAGVRTVVLRTAVVLSHQGGLLSKIAPWIKLGLGSAWGSGQQYMPWIHIQDLCRMYLKAIKDKHMEGVYNAVAPDQPTNRSFCKTLAKVLDKPFWLPGIPALFLRLALGEMSGMILKGSRISYKKIQSTGYEFEFTKLKKALKDLNL